MKTTLTFTPDDVNDALLMFAARKGWLGLAGGTPVATSLSYTLTRSDGKHSVSEVMLDVATDLTPEEVTLARARVSREAGR